MLFIIPCIYNARRLDKHYRQNPSSWTKCARRKQFDFLLTLYQGKFTKHWSVAIISCNGDYNAIRSRLIVVIVGHPLISSDCWRLRSLFHGQDQSYTFVIKRGFTTRDNWPTCPRTAVCTSTDDGRQGRGHLEEIAAKQCQLDPAVPTWLPVKPSHVSFPVCATRHHSNSSVATQETVTWPELSEIVPSNFKSELRSKSRWAGPRRHAQWAHRQTPSFAGP